MSNPQVCNKFGYKQAVCKNIMYLMAGYNEHEMNNTMLPYIVGHCPAGTSTLNMLHYGQVQSQALRGLKDFFESDKLFDNTLSGLLQMTNKGKTQ